MSKIERILVIVGCALLIVATLLYVLVLSTRGAGAQETEPCMAGEWYQPYVEFVAAAHDQTPLDTDAPDVLADKVINLYSIQFFLEALALAVPECAQPLVRKTAALVSIQADAGMLMVLLRNDLPLPEGAIAALHTQYTAQLGFADSVVQNAYDQLNLVEGEAQ